ncbi:hypothetical protein DMY87_04880 [Rhizobium wuzhouense]|uniref:GNAT family N-acetyltransferase n=1 Tax=Rhizobium wuzhouense TaxID=1986026 RepID=A0ABX5NWX7_9HYPH|nr:hypothetical protein DMY87_04880 [Rhizobium wuzhouense]
MPQSSSPAITALPHSSPGWPEAPYQGLWLSCDPDLSVSELPEGTEPLALFQAIRLGYFLTDRWLGRGLG